MIVFETSIRLQTFLSLLFCAYILAAIYTVQYKCPKQDLIHRCRVMLPMKQALYPQATTAG